MLIGSALITSETGMRADIWRNEIGTEKAIALQKKTPKNVRSMKNDRPIALKVAAHFEASIE